jgi:hypothetical protein
MRPKIHQPATAPTSVQPAANAIAVWQPEHSPAEGLDQSRHRVQDQQRLDVFRRALEPIAHWADEDPGLDDERHQGDGVAKASCDGGYEQCDAEGEDEHPQDQQRHKYHLGRDVPESERCNEGRHKQNSKRRRIAHERARHQRDTW